MGAATTLAAAGHDTPKGKCEPAVAVAVAVAVVAAGLLGMSTRVHLQLAGEMEGLVVGGSSVLGLGTKTATSARDTGGSLVFARVSKRQVGPTHYNHY